MPAVMMINTAISSSDVKQMWATPNWLPAEIGIIVEQGQVYCFQDQDLKLHVQRGVYNVQVYQLVGAVCEISSAEGQKPHLVSMVNGTFTLHLK
jgi:PAB-dependent poly(A)-specific ribonuclease subunit 2